MEIPEHEIDHTVEMQTESGALTICMDLIYERRTFTCEPRISLDKNIGPYGAQEMNDLDRALLCAARWYGKWLDSNPDVGMGPSAGTIVDGVLRDSDNKKLPLKRRDALVIALNKERSKR